MQFSRLLLIVAILLAPVALLGTTWLYLYPFFDQNCSFPAPPDAHIAPFRLLALGDPQLEGDSSLPKPGAPIFPSFNLAIEEVSNAVRAGNYTQAWETLRDQVKDEGLAQKSALEGVKWVWGKRKWIDLWGNDWYLGHIVRTLRWWTEPSHVAVLGDLLGSQWIKNEEFERRQRRYWDVVFKGMEKVPEYIMTGVETAQTPENANETEASKEGDNAEQDQNENDTQENEENSERRWGGTREVLGEDPRWMNRVINIAGNHDIGYAGDIDESRVARFERAFGQVNWDIVFTHPLNNTNTTSTASTDPQVVPELRLVVLNSMNLDTPVWTPSLQADSYDFLNHIVSTSRPVTSKTHTTLLLTHIPFHKEPGTCVDSPLFTYFEGGSGVKEQNMLSDYASRVVLEGIFGLNSNPSAEGKGFGRHGIVLNGHDHAGCDVLHWIEQPGATPACPHDVPLAQIAIPQFPAALDIEALAASSNDTTPPPPSSNHTTDGIPLEAPSDPSQDPPTENHDKDNSPEEEPPKNDQDSKQEDPIFQSLRYPPRTPYTTSSQTNQCVPLASVPRMREITLRSMMGDYAGYAGFLSAWYDTSASSSSEDGEGEGEGEWRFAFNTCGLGTQHWWWAVHIIDLICVVFGIVGGVLSLVVPVQENKVVEGKKKEIVQNGVKARDSGDNKKKASA
ncbi:unnamed protein product [Periconia digitata]|uniref:Calcineurin-like phosphoesterase domain-containing protein n=1 Tax=Periconia digitata TaxID=1303443 RepID=A0A9W4UI98_9PLEO|nr:unnamed protein product [Periconia digitata]